MANALITPSVIAKEALMQLENNLVLANNVHRNTKGIRQGGRYRIHPQTGEIPGNGWRNRVNSGT